MIVSTSGKADLYLKDEDGKVIYQGDDVESAEFSLDCEKSGVYTIEINADKHKGSFKFNW